MKYVKGFDTIRAFAVFVVVIAHWGIGFKPSDALFRVVNSFIQFGRFGVTLFFVLSGFLITSILLNEKAKHAVGKRLTIIRHFFLRRVLRIFPIYYLLILLCYLLNYQRDNIGYFLTYTSNLLAHRSNLETGATDPLFLHNALPHTWTLAVEEQFYLVWPWLIVLINNKYIKYVLFSAIIIGIASKYVVIFVFHHRDAYLVFNQFDSFGIGGLYAYVRLDENRRRKFEKAFIILFPFLLFIGTRMAILGGLPVSVLYYRLLDSLVGLALIMFALKNQSEWVRKYILENKVFNFIGKISYGLYLYHLPFSYAYEKLMNQLAFSHPGLPGIFLNMEFSYCLKSVLLIIICWLSYKLIEEPILRLKKRIKYA